MIITKLMIDSLKETIKNDNTICSVIRHMLHFIAKEAKKYKRVSVRKVTDLLAIQNVFITAYDEDLTSENLSNEAIKERIEVLKLLREMTNSLFDDAFIALDKRLEEFKDECQDKRKEELSGLTKDELIDLIKQLEEKAKEE